MRLLVSMGPSRKKVAPGVLDLSVVSFCQSHIGF
jgi:hypothetical protein